MTVAFWCLVAAVVIPYALAGTAGYYKVKQFGKLDNHEPRQQGAELTGAGARVWAAQQNAWEALAVFTAAVAVAHLAGVDPERTAAPALVFVAARLLHAACYLGDLASARSASFLVAFASCLWLFGLAAMAPQA